LEATRVLDLLVHAEKGFRESIPKNFPVTYAEAIGGTNNPRYGYHPCVVKKGARHVKQGVCFENTVGIDNAEEGIAGEIRRGIDGIRPAPVGFLNDDKVRQIGGFVNAKNFPSVEVAASEAVDPAEMETLLEERNGSVGRTVTDDDHLELWIV
jgi:hypothetical protein